MRICEGIKQLKAYSNNNFVIFKLRILKIFEFVIIINLNHYNKIFVQCCRMKYLRSSIISMCIEQHTAAHICFVKYVKYQYIDLYLENWRLLQFG